MVTRLSRTVSSCACRGREGALRREVATRFGRGGGELDICGHARTVPGGVGDAWCVRPPSLLPRSGPDRAQHHDIAGRDITDHHSNSFYQHTRLHLPNSPCPPSPRRPRNGSSTSTPRSPRSRRIRPSPIRRATRLPSRRRSAPYRPSSRYERRRRRRRWTRSR